MQREGGGGGLKWIEKKANFSRANLHYISYPRRQVDGRALYLPFGLLNCFTFNAICLVFVLLLVDALREHFTGHGNGRMVVSR